MILMLGLLRAKINSLLNNGSSLFSFQNIRQHYPAMVLWVLFCMVVTGATRTIAVKLFYQFGFDHAMLITLMYLLGQSLSLVVYLLVPAHYLSGDSNDAKKSTTTLKPEKEGPNNFGRGGGIQKHMSKTGLGAESEAAAEWVHSIPYYLKPLIPGFFNLCNSAMRWASLIYVPASIAEMLISGLELTLSVVAGRFIRKRMTSTNRWIAVGIITIGIVIVGSVDVEAGTEEVEPVVGEEDYEEATSTSKVGSNKQLIGLLLIVGQCIMSVLQDISEEIFMQEANFPATLLLGMEGLFGFMIGLIFYIPLRSKLEATDESSPWKQFENDWRVILLAANLVLLFTITGIFNILATAVTSSVTRNVWKNFRTILIWIAGLMIFYISKQPNLGEKWTNPESLIVLFGFFVMVAGTNVYYTKSNNNKKKIPPFIVDDEESPTPFSESRKEQVFVHRIVNCCDAGSINNGNHPVPRQQSKSSVRFDLDITDSSHRGDNPHGRCGGGDNSKSSVRFDLEATDNSFGGDNLFNHGSSHVPQTIRESQVMDFGLSDPVEIHEHSAPPQDLVMNLLQVSQLIENSRNRMLSGMGLSRQEWESLQDCLVQMGHTFEDDVKFNWQQQKDETDAFDNTQASF